MPNLSVAKIAGALAVLGTSVVISACGGSDPPAQTPVNAADTTAPAPGGAPGPSTPSTKGRRSVGRHHDGDAGGWNSGRFDDDRSGGHVRRDDAGSGDGRHRGRCEEEERLEGCDEHCGSRGSGRKAGRGCELRRRHLLREEISLQNPS